MFKNKCKNCNEKISSKHNFCEVCGFPQGKKNSAKDWGILGEKDSEENFQNMFGGFNTGFLNKMIGSAMKMLEKEMQKGLSKDNEKNPHKMSSNIRLMINGKEIDLGNKPNQKTSPQEGEKIERIKNSFSNKNLERFSKLPKKEPKANIKRFSDKIIYEIEIPKVKSIEDISIVNLENSIEIKAVTKDKAYFKIIPVSLPITNYNLERGKLFLELAEN